MEKIVTKLSDYTPNVLADLSLSDIAYIIKKDWKKVSKTGVNYAAAPYLDAMKCMSTIKDKYGAEDGKTIILYFLSNASTWKGPVAKEIKDYLKKLK